MNTKAKHPDHPNMHDLSDDMGAEFHGDNIVLYDTRAYSPRRLVVITSEEMAVLLPLYTDGCCPVCLEEIPEDDIICDECLENARNMRRLGPR